MRWCVALLVIVACSKPKPQPQQPKVLATLDGDAQAIAVDDAFVYVAIMDLGKPSIVRVPKDGGDVQTIVAKTSAVEGLAVDGGKIFWSEIAMEDTVADAGPAIITQADINAHGGIGAAVSVGVRHFVRVMTAPTSGGTATKLGHFEGTASDLALDEASIYVLSEGAWPTDGEIDSTQGALVKMPKTGGAITVLASHLNKPRDLVVDAASVYWSASDGAWKIAKSGGSPEHATLPSSNHTNDPFEHAVVVGKTRYHTVNKDMKMTLTAEPLPAK